MDTTRDRTGRDDPERLGPLVIEHDHGLSHGRETSRWTKFDGRRDQDPDIDRGRSPCLAGSSQERFRTSNFRSDRREDARRRPQEDWRGADHTETRRSPAAQDRGNNSRYGSHRGRSGPHPARGRYSHGQAGKNGPHRNQPSSQGYQDVSNEETRTGLQPFREDLSENPTEGEADWAEGTRDHEWKPDRPGRLDRHVPKIDLDPKMPRQRMQKWIDQRTSNMAAVIEETLTIKVDMSRPTVKNRWSMFHSVLRVRGESSHFCLSAVAGRGNKKPQEDRRRADSARIRLKRGEQKAPPLLGFGSTVDVDGPAGARIGRGRRVSKGDGAPTGS